MSTHVPAGQPRPMTPDQVIAAWRDFDYTFPEEAFRVAGVRTPELAERMLEEITDVADFPELLDLSEYWSSMFSLYVLAWYREKRVVPVIRRLLDKTGEDFYELWGESVVEDAPRLFASWAYSEPEILKQIVEMRPKDDELTRSSALEAYIVLYHAGAVAADGMRPYLRHLADSVLRKRADSRDGWLWYSWGRCCVDMGLEDLYPLVKKAYEEEWVDPMITRWEDEEKEILKSRESILERSRRDHGGLIEDPVAELGGWHCFTEEARQEDLRREREAEREEPEPSAPPFKLLFHPDTIVNETPKVKPNQPCPCGSGKKYKKCCGRG